MIVTSFFSSSSLFPSFSYRGSCEHTLVTTCGLLDSFAITVDFLATNLSLGRVGVRLGGAQKLVVHEDSSVHAQGFGTPVISSGGSVEEYDSMIRITRSLNNITINATELGIVLSLTRGDNRTSMLVVDASNYNHTRGEICGLCGNLTGRLVHSDGVTVVRVRKRETLLAFARSWQVNPGEQILRQESRECGELLASQNYHHNR